MTYSYNHARGQIIDDEDGQVIAIMSESATPEQGASLVDAYNKLQADLSISLVQQPVLTAEQRARQTEILKYGDGFVAYCLAKDVPGADKAALQACVLANGDGYDAYLFARDIPGADVAKLQAQLIEIGNAIEAYLFARDILGADIQPLYARAEVLKFAGLDQLQRDDFKARVQALRDSLSNLTDSVSSEPTPVP